VRRVQYLVLGNIPILTLMCCVLVLIISFCSSFTSFLRRENGCGSGVNGLRGRGRGGLAQSQEFPPGLGLGGRRGEEGSGEKRPQLCAGWAGRRGAWRRWQGRGEARRGGGARAQPAGCSRGAGAICAA
jgi:hypothetical protein